MKTRSQSEALDLLETLPGYRRHFMDLSIWRPFVLEMCQRHEIAPASIRPGLAGTYPTFIVDDRWVIKFFGRLFDGLASFEVERQIGRLLQASPQVPIARVLYAGRMENGLHPWDYLIFEFIHGDSIGAVYGEITLDNKIAIARELGTLLGQLHRLQLPGMQAPRFPETSRDLQTLLGSWVRERQKKNETGLPPHLAFQLTGYLEKTRALFPGTKPHLIHADVTRDHIFGDFRNGHWKMHALIDFGDVMHANIFYELAALHLDVFDCDQRLLSAFLETYPLVDADRQNFRDKCMLTALQHQFDVFSFIFERHPSFAQAKTLDELAARIWSLDTPGLPG